MRRMKGWRGRLPTLMGSSTRCLGRGCEASGLRPVSAAVGYYRRRWRPYLREVRGLSSGALGATRATGADPVRARAGAVVVGVAALLGLWVVPAFAGSVVFGVGSTPTYWTSSETQTYDVTLYNYTGETWVSGGSTPYRLSVQFMHQGGGFASGNGSNFLTSDRFSLPADLASGGSVTLTVAVTAPADVTASDLVVDYQMVHEGMAWVNPWADVAVSDVAPSPSPSPSPSASPSPSPSGSPSPSPSPAGAVVIGDVQGQALTYVQQVYSLVLAIGALLVLGVGYTIASGLRK